MSKKKKKISPQDMVTLIKQACETNDAPEEQIAAIAYLLCNDSEENYNTIIAIISESVG